MPQRESVPAGYTLLAQLPEGQANGFAAQTSNGDDGQQYQFTVEVLRPNLLRTTFSSALHPLPPYPSASKPEANLGDAEVVVQQSPDETKHALTVGDINLTLALAGPPQLSLRFEDQDDPLYQDLPYRSYAVDGPGVAHYTSYDPKALHVGLGEKSAPMDLTGRQFRITATDSFGYDVYRTDPLYKHIPLLICATPAGVVAQFCTSHSRAMWSVGSEMDGLWGRYKVYRQDYGGLEEYLILGRNLQQVVKTYADIVGYPMLVPRWSFGYIAGGYKYAMSDEPKAYDVLMDFAAKLREHDIPCSAMQLSSGYHVSHEEPKVRNVFCWNRYRFPDPAGWLKEYRQAGLKVLANVKPFLLRCHRDFDSLLKQDAFFTDPHSKKAGYMRLWSAGGGESGEGCHLDFTSRAAQDFWHKGVRGLGEDGIAAIWNDNNEYPMPDDNWELKLDEGNLPSSTAELHGKAIGLWGRAMQAELMAKVSYEAMTEVHPQHRPFVLTRSATAGTMRYACSSWSGDNQTSWESMRGANAISLNAGMSLLQCFGHDIGGFEGPQPTPELLVRWVQIGAYSPRFAINCFKTSPEDNLIGEVIEPWMYPDVTHLVRAAIKRRYEILPYIYSLSLESHLTATPPQRWVGWGFESDPEVWSSRLLKEGETQYWLGDSLLIGGVFEPGVDQAKLYLPHKTGMTDGGYINLNKPYQHFTAGQWVDVTSDWASWIPVLARVGGAVPIGKDIQTASPGDETEPGNMAKDDYRGVEIFPAPSGTVFAADKPYTNDWLEDDGISIKADVATIHLHYHSDETTVHVSVNVEKTKSYTPKWESIEIVLPQGDGREVVGFDGCETIGSRQKQDGRGAFKLSCQSSSSI